MVFVIQSSKIIRVCAYGEYYAEERDALIQIRETLNSTLDLHSIWTGRPCWNNYSNWVGIGCLNSHVVHIVLEGIQLTGSLPPMVLHNITLLSKLSLRNNSLFGSLPNLANLNQLQSVSLSDNRFTGSIPLEFIDLPNLSQLELQENLLTGTIPPFSQPTLIVFNVSNNRLQGEIPETPELLRFPESSYDHNLELCGKPLRHLCPAPPVSAPPSPALTPPNPKQTKDNKLKIWSIALIAVAAALVPFTLVLVFLCYRRMKGRGRREDEHSGTYIFLQIDLCKSQFDCILNWTNPIHKLDEIKLKITNLIKVVPTSTRILSTMDRILYRFQRLQWRGRLRLLPVPCSFSGLFVIGFLLMSV